MRYFDSIKQLEKDAIKTYLLEHLKDDAFIYEVVENKEELLPLLLKHRVLNDTISLALAKKQENLNFLISHLINEKFIPGQAFIDYIVENGFDKQLNQLLTEFPSIPISLQFLMKLINLNLLESATGIVKAHSEFQKTEILLKLAKSGIEDEGFLKIAIQNTAVLKYISHEISSNNYHSKLSSKFINNFVILADDISGIYLERFLDKELSVEAFKRVLRDGKRSDFHRLVEINWTDDIEAIEEKNSFRGIFIKNPPKKSKFRLAWLIENPTEASDAEFQMILNTRMSPKICQSLVSRKMSLIKSVNIELIEANITPVKLTDSVSGNEEKLVYFYENLSSKFKPALRKVLPDNFLEKTETSNRRSYFNDIFLAIKEKNIDSFRLYSSKGYTLDQFSLDSHQKSKARSCELVYIPIEISKKFTKDEFLALIPSHLPFSGFWSEKAKFKFTLTAKEAILAKEKFSASNVFDMCSEKETLLLSTKISGEDVSSIFNEYRKEIMNDSVLFKAYLSRAKGKEVSFNDDDIVAFSKIFSSKEIKKLADPMEHLSTELINLVCKDKEYYLSENDLIKMAASKYTLESDTFFKEMKKRDVELLKRILTAYVGGNKALSELVGEDVKMHRQKLSTIQGLLNDLTNSAKDVIEKIFKKGGKLEDFKKQLINWDEELQKYAAGKTVFIDVIAYSSLIPIARKIPDLTIQVGIVNLKYDGETTRLNNVQIESIELDTERSLDGYLKLIKMYKIPQVNISPDATLVSKVRFCQANIGGGNLQEIINTLMETLAFKEFSIEDLKFLMNNGLLISETVIQSILDVSNLTPEMLNFLFKKTGSLNGYYVRKLHEYSWDRESKSKLEKYLRDVKLSGATVLNDAEIGVLKFKKSLLPYGENFPPIALRDKSVQEVSDLIKFIENELDPNYAKLNLLSSNLENIDELLPYSVMKSVHSLDEKDLIDHFLIPKNVSSNRKIMKGIQDLLAIKTKSLIYKVTMYKTAMETIMPSLNLELSDLLDYSNPEDVIESETLKAMNNAVLAMIPSCSEWFHGKKAILQNKSKKEVNRFLRSASNHGQDYLRDIFDSIDQVLKGLAALNDRLSHGNLTEEQKAQTQTIITGVSNRLDEVRVIFDAEHMHDRLGTLLNFIEQDEFEPIGQDKFSKIENEKKIIKRTGVNLYFPKVRSDLVFLGNENNWCVNNNNTYFEGVQQKGNILVGICPADKSAEKENVIALAHFVKKSGSGEYFLEQLRWSSKLKNGERNVDASEEFNHSEILSEILSYLYMHEAEQREAKRLKEANENSGQN